ncbi:NAD(P)-dependent oxidoreductase [Sphaerisporangium corydalis]|uniref:NAD(P)-dependent oxidoreductase n=1 Tax=Sphaerisporangium corydalis TaxID=1441875 RepID=A0ABV9EQH5_9ACTN|nr:NAD(P)-dependent oxidoreductase [Sphaerisporangium corydalis]
MTDDPGRPVVILKPAPHGSRRIFTEAAFRALHERFTVVDLEADDSPEAFDRALPDAFAIVGQPDLPRERLARAPRLRALLNVEGNFYPNVDYETCYEQGVHVLGCGPAYAQAVAEYSLGLALDLARGISREDRAFRAGRERYVADGNGDAILLRNADVGLVGFGNLGRALRTVLTGFAPVIRVYDPWLPDGALREHGVVPAGLGEVLARSTFLFVLATVTDESRHLLDAEHLAMVPPGARIILVSRAPVVDHDALVAGVAEGRFLAAVDVWPDEPVPAGHPARGLEGMVLSAHRAGGIPAAFLEIGEMVLDDLTLMARGLPPARMQVAARELVGRYRNRPVDGPG